MIDLEVLRDCYTSSPTKIVLLVVDGLGGLAHPETGLSELETAHIPNLDAMAQESACGLTTPVLPGVAPGSGSGHLALFGYDPLKHLIGRGALEALIGLAVSDGAGSGSCPGVLVVSRRGEPFTDKRVRLEFGLGLKVIATEMNQTSRADRQLKSRSGRQGAFGASRFILSLEDRFLQHRGDNAACLVDGPHVDAGERTFYEGPRMEHHLAWVQRQAESDDEVSRSLGHQYGHGLEAQSRVYYRGRKQIVEAGSFHDVCLGFVEGWAARLVRRHFADQWPVDYDQQFEGMAEELWLDLSIDCDDLYGTGLDSLATEVAHLVKAKLEEAQAAMGEVRFTRLEKLLFLRTADEFWRDHLACQEEFMLNIPLGYLSVKAAMAELRVRGFEAYELFKVGTLDAFLPRLLAFPIESVSEGEGESIDLSDDVLSILVERSPVVAVDR